MIFPDAKVDRNLIPALALSLVVHSLALLSASAPPKVDGSTASLRAVLRQTPQKPSAQPAAPAAADEPAVLTVPAREPEERTYEKAAPVKPSEPVPAEEEKTGEDATIPNGDTQANDISASQETAPLQQLRDGIDLVGLRQYNLALGRAASHFRIYPQQAREAGWEGRVGIRLLVSEAGVPAGLTLLSSSGFAVIDRAALEMLALAARHTMVPESLRGRAFTIDLAVDYNLRNEQ